jgi:beta-glucanase (GH16 family)
LHASFLADSAIYYFGGGCHWLRPGGFHDPTATMMEPSMTPIPSLMPTPSLTPIAIPSGWRLDWHDEFDGVAIDRAQWTFDLGGGGWGNGELEYYTDRPENARVENGLLVIEARKESYEISDYTSARMKTEGRRTFQNGRMEGRVKVPDGSGLWPAFWLLGENISRAGWPDCGEIDIMEYVGRDPNLILGTLHGPGYSGAFGLSKSNRQAFNIADDFHIYAVEWEPERVDWFFDGVKYFTVNRSDVGKRDWPFQQPFFVILNLAVGGSFGGVVGNQTNFPKDYLVDYVRYYRRITP